MKLKSIFMVIAMIALFAMALLSHDPMERSLFAACCILVGPVLSHDWLGAFRQRSNANSAESLSERALSHEDLNENRAAA